ncbi:MAG: mechanosensitive ion channel family protein [Candidatus Micrarchaeota archaeon]
MLSSIPYAETVQALPGGDITIFALALIVLSLLFQAGLGLTLRMLGYLVRRTQTTLDDRIVKAIRPYLPAIAVFTALYLSLRVVFPDSIMFGKFSELDIYIILMLGVVGLLLSSLANALLLWYGLELRPGKRKVDESQVYPFVRNVIKIAINILFLVFILQRLGFDTTAIITGLGIGGLAVALALQDTLANFFGGLHILIDKPFRQFDYIKVDDNTEGTVQEIGWRTTRLITTGKDEIVVPNSKLAGSTLKNYSTPRDETGVSYTIGVDYNEDIDRVEKIITDVLVKVGKSNGDLKEDTHWVRFDSYGDFALMFKFGYMVQGYRNQWGVWKEVNRELFYAFRKNEVKMPFPLTRFIQSK